MRDINSVSKLGIYTLLETLSYRLQVSRLQVLHDRKREKIKKSESFELALSKFGIDLLSHLSAVPSALTGLTSLFGMGRGGSPSL